MLATTQFVGASVGTLLAHDRPCPSATDIDEAARDLLGSLCPIGDPFEVPWKFTDGISLFVQWLPEDLCERLLHPNVVKVENHLEASIVALALEARVCLQPLSRNDVLRLQHVTERVTAHDAWGRQSPYPWDTFAEASLDDCAFFALASPT